MRPGNEADHAALAELVYDAVRSGPSPYTQAQRAAWMPAPRSGPAWSERLSDQTIIVEENDREIRGFMSLRRDGYIDFAYIRPSYRGVGVFRRLFGEVQALAAARGDTRLWVHASLMAEPAFTAMGFRIIRRETVAIGDEALDRFEMEMRLTGD